MVGDGESCAIHFPSSLSDTCQHKIWEVVSASMQWAAETEMIGLGCSVKDIDQRSLRFKGEDNHHFDPQEISGEMSWFDQILLDEMLRYCCEDIIKTNPETKNPHTIFGSLRDLEADQSPHFDTERQWCCLLPKAS